MKAPYLEVTYRKGKPLAAYLYLARMDGDQAQRTVSEDAGLVVDYSADGRPIGIEITTPRAFSAAALNGLLTRLKLPTIPPRDLAPLDTAA
jgi:uncharacterized protein YuzE